MKKTLLLVLLTTLTLISCQKESDVLPKGNNANYYVENGILNVKNQSVLDSLVAANFEKSEEEVVAWSDSLGFKSLASVYKDAEKEKDALTVEELKAKYEGRLVFNTEKGAEKEFTCAVENIGMAGLVNETATVYVNGEKKNLKSVVNLGFHPNGGNLLKSIPAGYCVSFDGKRWIQVGVQGGRLAPRMDGYPLGFFPVECRSEKKVLGRWYRYNTNWHLIFRNSNRLQDFTISSNPGIIKIGLDRFKAGDYYFEIWSDGVSIGRSIKINSYGMVSNEIPAY